MTAPTIANMELHAMASHHGPRPSGSQSIRDSYGSGPSSRGPGRKCRGARAFHMHDVQFLQTPSYHHGRCYETRMTGQHMRLARRSTTGGT